MPKNNSNQKTNKKNNNRGKNGPNKFSKDTRKK